MFTVTSQKTHLDIMDMFKQITAMITDRQVKGAVEAALLLTQPTHLMVPWSKQDIQYSGADFLSLPDQGTICRNVFECQS